MGFGELPAVGTQRRHSSEDTWPRVTAGQARGYGDLKLAAWGDQGLEG